MKKWMGYLSRLAGPPPHHLIPFLSSEFYALLSLKSKIAIFIFFGERVIVFNE